MESQQLKEKENKQTVSANYSCKECTTINRPIARFCKGCGISISYSPSIPIKGDRTPGESFGLNQLVDRNEIKEEFSSLINTLKIRETRINAGQEVPPIELHAVFLGNPGTGKTLVAEVLAYAYKQLNILSRGILVEADEKEWSQKQMTLLKQAKGGILVLDEAHKLIESGEKFLEEVIKAIEKGLEDTVIILCGLPGKLNEWLNDHPDVKARFPRLWHFEDYSAKDLLEIAKINFNKYDRYLVPDAETTLMKYLEMAVAMKNKNFKNAWLVMKDIFNETDRNQNDRLVREQKSDPESLAAILPEDLPGFQDNRKSREEIMEELNKLVGMDNIKEEIKTWMNFLEIQKKKQDEGKETQNIYYHIVLTGNPGTGKTTIARILADVLYSTGILPTDHLVETDRSDLVAGYVGQSAIKTQSKIDEAMGGVLFIDEAYALVGSEEGLNDSFGDEVISTLLKRMEDDRGKFVVIAAGYSEEMDRFIRANPGLASRFNKYFHFEDFTAEEMTEILRRMVSKGFTLEDDFLDRALKGFRRIVSSKDKTFANGRTVRNIFDLTIQKQANRLTMEEDPDLSLLLCSDLPFDEDSDETLEEILASLDELIGLNELKKQVRSLIDFLNVQKQKEELGEGSTIISNHMVFTGNPGTGKTTVARILGKIFKKIGLLVNGQVVDVDRSRLVGTYMGQTPKIVNARVDEAMGGILLVDEAYSLAPEGGDKYGQEAIDTLIKRMEDDRGKFVMIAAGYQDDMERFINANDGLKSRFQRYLHFPDYNGEELSQIFNLMVKQNNYVLAAKAQKKMTELCNELYENRDEHFGNARDIRNIFEGVIQKQSERLAKKNSKGKELSREDIITILPDDLPDTKGASKEISIELAMDKLNSLTGLNGVKSEIASIIAFLKAAKIRMEHGGDNEGINDHYVFTGNPGTGKTTVARIFAEIFKALEVLPKGHLVEVDRSSLVGEYIGQTGPKTHGKVDEAMGGILFIDEAYSLTQGGENDFGKEAIEALMTRMENDRGKFIIIVAGYTNEMRDFLEVNPGLTSRFSRTIQFDDYEPTDLLEIFISMTSKKKMQLTEGALDISRKKIEHIYENRDHNFANAREIRKLFEEVMRRQALRIQPQLEEGDTAQMNIIDSEDIPEIEIKSKGITVDEALEKLDTLIGLGGVKSEIQSIIAFLKVAKLRMEHGGSDEGITDHYVFTGNPGTGKTTVARIFAEIFKALGVLPKGHLVEVDRSKLVAEYVGQTGPKTNARIDKAMGGILFIDEAYGLSQGGGNDFGKEAIEALMTRMENDRGKFIVIVAGYTNEMNQFLEVNPGLTSRFSRTIHFDDYGSDDLMKIFELMVDSKGMKLSNTAVQAATKKINKIYKERDKNFANAREVRKLFEDVMRNQALRIQPLIEKGDTGKIHIIEGADI